MAMGSWELWRRHGLMAVLCLLACGEALAARGPTDVKPRDLQPVPTLPPALSAASCETKREEMQANVRKMLRLPANVNVRDEPALREAIKENCFENLLAPADKRKGKACASSFEEIVRTLVRSDKFIEAACGSLKAAGQRMTACKAGEAKCIKEAARQFEKAKRELADASKVLDAGAKKLMELRKANRETAEQYGATLLMISTTIKDYALQGKELKLGTAEFEQAVGNRTRGSEGMTATDLMNIYGIERADPVAIERKAEIIRREIERDRGSIDEGGVFAGQQLRAAYSAHQVAAFSARQSESIRQTEQVLAREVAALDDLSRRYESAPSPTPAARTPPAGQQQRPTQVASVEPAAKGPGEITSTAASRPMDISNASSTPQPGRMNLPGPQLGGFSGGATGGRRLASTGTFGQPAAKSLPAKTFPGAAPRERPERTEPSEGITSYPEKEKGALPVEPVVSQAPAQPFSPPTSYPQRAREETSAPAPAREPGSPAEAPTLAHDMPPDHQEPARPAGTAERATTIPAEKLAPFVAKADERLARLDRGRSLRGSIRERLRAALAKEMMEKELGGSSEYSSAPSAAGGALKRVLLDMQSEGTLPEVSFELDSFETEAEIRRMLASLPEDGAIAGDALDSSGMSLFERVRSTYARVSRSRMQ